MAKYFAAAVFRLSSVFTDVLPLADVVVANSAAGVSTLACFHRRFYRSSTPSFMQRQMRSDPRLIAQAFYPWCLGGPHRTALRLEVSTLVCFHRRFTKKWSAGATESCRLFRLSSVFTDVLPLCPSLKTAVATLVYFHRRFSHGLRCGNPRVLGCFDPLPSSQEFSSHIS